MALASLTTTVASSGDPYIDGLLDGVRWLVPITYSLPAQPSDYGPGYGDQNAITDGFAALNATQRAEVAHIVGTEVSNFLAAPVTYLGDNGQGLIRFAQSDAPVTSYAYYPSNDPTGGDIFVGDHYASDVMPVPGTYGWQTFTHELGHALGLKHPHDTGETGFGPMPLDRDGLEFTVMTYKSVVGAGNGYYAEEFGYPQSFMMYDVAALQYLYGADFSGRGGNTHYQWDPATGQELVDGTVQFTPGANRIFLTVWDGDGRDLYDFSNYTVGLHVDLAPGGWSTLDPNQLANLGLGQMARGSIANALQYQGDARSLIEDAIGGNGSDTLSGNAATNLIVGGGGGDTIYGVAGDDTLAGGDGNDTLYGDTGTDTLVGDAGDDFLYGGTESDVLNGDRGNDRVYGDEGDDALVGGAEGDDTVYGGAGDDSLRGDAGNDTLFGGAGHDTFFGGSGTDTLGDFTSGVDVIDLTPYHVHFSDLSITGGAQTTIVVADQTLVLSGVSPGSLTSADFAGLQADVGTDGDDLLVGGNGRDVFFGLGGDDLLAAAGGDDTLYGGVGNDTLAGHEGNDTLYGGADNDFLDGSVGDDVVWGGDGNERLAGGAQGADTVYGDGGSDSLRGDDGNDTLFGGADGDTLFGGHGDDTLYGGDGSDVFVASHGESGIDRIGDFTKEIDKIDLSGLHLRFSELSFSGASDTTLSLSDQTLVLTNVSLGALSANDFIGLEPEGSISGTSGNELLVGGAVSDTIFGLAGDDTLGGVAGNDTLYGGIGNDTLLGDPGADALYGDEDGDFLDGGPGNDRVDGGDGNDFVGGAQDNDTVYGGGGDDTVTGDTGDDTLFGGAGADQFIYHSLIPGNGTDTIADFTTLEDKVVLFDLGVSSYNGSTATLTDGTIIIAGDGHTWTPIDFTLPIVISI